AERRGGAREPGDLRPVAASHRLAGRDPGTADAEHVGQTEISFRARSVDTPGRAEAYLGQGRGHRLEPGNAARGLGREELEAAITPLEEAHDLADARRAGQERHRARR